MSSMASLDAAHLRHVAQSIPRDVRRLMSANPRRLIVGGGFVREIVAGNEARDIDLFCDTKERAAVIAKDLVNERGDDTRIHESDNAITVLTPGRVPVQFITRWVFEKPLDAVRSFDFTVCQAAIWREGPKINDAWVGVCSPRFYQDLAGRNLVYTSPMREEEAGGSLLRVVKFLKRGYHIQVGSLGEILNRLYIAVEKETKSGRLSDLEAIDMLLREVDPQVVIDGLEAVHVHEEPKDGEAKTEDGF